MPTSDFPSLPSIDGEPGLCERPAPDGTTTVWIVGSRGEELWTSRIRTDLLDADTRSMLRSWASAQIRREMRATRACALRAV